jgi:hypothetical protein
MAEEPAEPLDPPQPDGDASNYIEPDTHAFVVKIWLEAPATVADGPIWRGHITHVASGRRRQIDRLYHIVAFVAGYLRDMEIRLPLIERIYQWLGR